MWKRREKMSVRGKKINDVVRYHLKSDANKIRSIVLETLLGDTKTL